MTFLLQPIYFFFFLLHYDDDDLLSKKTWKSHITLHGAFKEASSFKYSESNCEYYKATKTIAPTIY